MTICCGPRPQATPRTAESPKFSRPDEDADGAGSAAPAAVGKGFGRLLVRVVRAEGLMGMDISGVSVGKLSFDRTLDAYVTLRIDEDPLFGKTTVKWKSKGEAVWDERFEVNLKHPRAHLCLSVMDDDAVFRQDTTIALLRHCGYIEVPLFAMPRNRAVTGWFTLMHPDLWDSRPNPNSRGAQQDLAPPESVIAETPPAGRVKLELFLEATTFQEIRGNMREPPVFKEALPALNLPKFLDDIFEVKRLFLQQLILPPIAAISYALSWSNFLLGCVLTSWWVFLFFRPQFVCASVFFLVLLCFWHRKVEQSGGSSEQGTPTGSTGTPRTIQGALVKGGQILTTGAKGLKDSVAGKLAYIRRPGLQEFQQVLILFPSLKTTVRGLQPTVAKWRGALEKVEGIFYWGQGGPTRKLVGVIVTFLVLSLVFSQYTPIVTWYIALVGGTFVLAHNMVLVRLAIKLPRAVIATSTRPQVPFKGRAWFEATN